MPRSRTRPSRSAYPRRSRVFCRAVPFLQDRSTSMAPSKRSFKIGMLAPRTSSTIENFGCPLKRGQSCSLRMSAADLRPEASSPGDSSIHVASTSEFRVPKPLAALPKSFKRHAEPILSTMPCSSRVQRAMRAFSSLVKVLSAILASISRSSLARGPRPPRFPRPTPFRLPYCTASLQGSVTASTVVLILLRCRLRRLAEQVTVSVCTGAGESMSSFIAEVISFRKRLWR
mmetsp:Transcript_112397/g.324698  ORF Transcript_112397/g.324698 Transcript_112397/m.324698 type:complete len:230 (-) Transcript_112397:142-831(-)